MGRIFTPDPHEAAALKRSLAARPFVVIGLCAAWCGTCGEFRDAFAGVAATRADATFVWLDIEDDAELAGDIDVENFPTIAVFHGDWLLHFGVSLPQPAVLSRLLGALSESSATIVAETAVIELVRRLHDAVAQPG